MLKCPSCHRRVVGQDLVKGICSHCGKDLLASSQSVITPIKVTGDPTSDTIDPISLDKSKDSKPKPGIGEQTILEGDFDESALLTQQSHDAPGTLQLSVAPEVDKTIDSHDLDEESVHHTQDRDGTEQTFISSVEDAPGVDPNKTFAIDAEGPHDKQQSDTATESHFADLNSETNAKTIVTDGEGDDDSNREDKTVVLSDEPESLMKTIASVWGDGINDRDTKADLTFKGKDDGRPERNKQTLVIKTKSLVESKDFKSSSLLQNVRIETKDAEYELIRVLGEGGMGVVYDARQTSINRNVALKMIKGDAAKNEKQNSKFLAEAVVTGDLDHPNIVPIYDVGANAQGHLFYSMKKVQGTPWLKVIRERSLTENLDILMRTADAIGFAHARGIVHRDLKPENIMLGEFGEVLVMDWGLAHALSGFQKSDSITSAHSMGGTPAYMAPEMATGPIEKIGPASDIYLLGAMLYEILTGRPPHVASSAMKCLVVAARNEITPTDKTGELVDVALKAMSTEPKDRHQDVKEFQAAIREYQSHSDSILMSARAEEDLVEARRTDDYQNFSRALFGFQEAKELWPGNKRAVAGESDVRLAYAGNAMRKGDLDLGLSLLEESNSSHASLRHELIAAKTEREAKQKRLVLLRRAAVGLVATIFITVTGAAIWIRSEQQKALTEADRASKAEKVALNEKAKAEAAFEAEQKSKLLAIAAEQEAVAQKLKAEEAKQKEEYESYISKIGLAASQTDKNAFDAARDVLGTCKASLRNWEWGRLMHLCSQNVRSFDAKSPLEALAIANDGKRFATGGWGGMARLWDRQTREILMSFKHGGEYVNAVALSPDGQFLATGSNDTDGFIQIWNIETGHRIKVIKGHDDEVVSVSYSKDGTKLLSSSYDKTARLWDVETGQEIKKFAGHSWWVWSAAFSADNQRIVTASQDGTAIVWTIASGERTPAFAGHRGPVFAATFSPDGKQVVTAGYDHRILAWNPDEVKSFDFSKIAEDSLVQSTAFRAFDGHTDAVRSITFSADGSLLASAGHDNTVRVWDFSTGQTIKTFRGHGGRVKYAAFLPDGQGLLSASEDNSVREWSIGDYEEIRTLQGRQLSGHVDSVLSATYSRDQTQIVTASRDRTARSWNTKTGEPITTFSEGHSYLASTAVFFPNGRRLLTAAVDNTARVWNVETGGQLLRLDRSGRSAAAALSGDAKWIATGADDKSVQLWDAETGTRLKKLEAHLVEVTAVAFSPDDHLLASGDSKGHVKIWNLEKGTVATSLNGHTRRISAIAFSSDGSRVLTASSDNTVGQWDVASGRERADLILKHPDGILAMQRIPGGNTIVTSCADRKIRVWNVDQAKVEQTIGPFEGDVYSLSVSVDGRRLLAANSEERTVRLWDLETSREVQFPQPSGKLGPLIDLNQHGGLLWSAAFLPGSDDVLTMGGSDARLWDVKAGKEKMSFSQHGAVASANFSPDGKMIVTGSWDNSAKVWDSKTGKVLQKLEGEHTSFINTATFSPDGATILTASDDGTAKLWNCTSGKVLVTFEGHQGRVRSAEFSRDGKLILTTSNDKTARLWIAESGKLQREFKGHDWAVTCGVFSPDSQRIVTGSEDNTARIWNVETGEPLQTLSGHAGAVTSAAFSPDMVRVITGSQDHTAKLWDASTGKEILTLSRHNDEVTSVAFSPDGSQILTGSRDGTAVIWLSQKWGQQGIVAFRQR